MALPSSLPPPPLLSFLNLTPPTYLLHHTTHCHRSARNQPSIYMASIPRGLPSSCLLNPPPVGPETSQEKPRTAPQLCSPPQTVRTAAHS